MNLTIRDIANDVGLTTSAISVIERGSDPQLSTASKLAAFFGVSIQDLWPQRYHDPKPHIERVRDLLCDVREDLIVRGQVHDDSKLKPPEKDIFDEFTPVAKQVSRDSNDVLFAELSRLDPELHARFSACMQEVFTRADKANELEHVRATLLVNFGKESKASKYPLKLCESMSVHKMVFALAQAYAVLVQKSEGA